MKYISAFREGKVARVLADRIRQAVDAKRQYRLMEFCGGHTHTIFRYGLAGLLPANIKMIHGPGCPVCVLPTGRIDGAIRLAQDHGVILCTYGDLMRVPGSRGTSLLKAKAAGADVRMVYSAMDALKIAEQHSGREVVFFGIGFTQDPAPVVFRGIE